ncbi:hypothetical protein MZM54_02015 [[Brevibacterium] frigoritolerans]|nr:hypothetical protein [Peribacillus frigoritolerans]
MTKDYLLLLRDIALSQGHIANLQGEELVINFFQDSRNDVNETIRIHIKLNDWEIKFHFSFDFQRIKISWEGETKLVTMFEQFIKHSNYKGVIVLSSIADDDSYDLEHAFWKFLKAQVLEPSDSVLNELSKLIQFEHRLVGKKNFKIEDLTNTLHFLQASTSMRWLPDGQISLIQRHYDEQIIMFNNIEELAIFLNECHQSAKKVRTKWEKITGESFHHTFRLQGKNLVFTQGFYMSNVNEQFFEFTESVLKAKNEMYAYSKRIIEDFILFTQKYPELYFLDHTSLVKLVPGKDSIRFDILKFDLLFLNKRYTANLKFEPMMNGMVLEFGKRSLVYTFNRQCEVDKKINEMKEIIQSYFSEIQVDLIDAIDVIKFVDNESELANDSSFFTLVGPDQYRFISKPPVLKNRRYISTDDSFAIRSFSKNEFIRICLQFINVNKQIEENLIPIISTVNFNRAYERNQVFIINDDENFKIVTASNTYPLNFRIKDDSTVVFETGNNVFSVPIDVDDLYESAIRALDMFERQFVLTHIFSADNRVNQGLKAILWRYSLTSSITFENNTPYAEEEIFETVENVLATSKIEHFPNLMLNDFEAWVSQRIDYFLDLFKGTSTLFLEFDAVSCTFYIKKQH